jgi:SAM-dependent methyltransferase
MSKIPNTPCILNENVPWANIEPIEKTNVKCPLCYSDKPEPIASLIINDNEFYLVRCINDRVIWMNPQPGPTFLTKLYSQGYYEVIKYSPQLVYQVGIRNASSEDERNRIESARKNLINLLEFGINPRGKRFLDIGCGRGYLLKMMDEQGSETLGIDISDYAIKACHEKDLNVVALPIENLLDYPEIGQFDLVGMYDSLEHVTNPRQILQITNSIMRPNGVLVIRIPNTDEVRGPRLHLIDHLWHFSERNLEALLDLEGFRVLVIRETGIFPPGATSPNLIKNMTIFAEKI